MKPTDMGMEAAPIERFAEVCEFPPDAARQAALNGFQVGLRLLSSDARKLLVHIAELATRPVVGGRKKNASYLPELHETCGLDVDAMYRILDELKENGFVQIEGEYPFQDVVLVPDQKTGWLLIADLNRFCVLEKISFRDLIVESSFVVLR